MRNNRGDVKLETILDAGLAAVSRLASSNPPQPSQLPWARELETEVPLQRERARKCSAALNTLETTCKTEIADIRPILYESVRDRERLEWFVCLRSLPLVPLVLPHFLSSGTNDSTLKEGVFYSGEGLFQSNDSVTFLILNLDVSKVKKCLFRLINHVSWIYLSSAAK